MLKKNLVLKILTNRFHANDSLEFLQYLSEEERNIVKEIPLDSTELDPLIRDPAKDLSEIHYSWIAPFLRKFPSELMGTIIHSFDLNQRKGLSHMLECKPSINPPSPLVSTYYLNQLSTFLIDPSILSREYLPQSDLAPLLDLNKGYLVEMIDLFGIYDLGEKIRAIVDKTRLRAIYKCLSPVKLKFLEFVLRHTEKISLSEFDLAEWDGNCSKLLHNIHKWGLLRLAKVLSKENHDFIWHLTHKLDTGRAEFLKKHMKEATTSEMIKGLKNQLTTIVNLINKRRP